MEHMKDVHLSIRLSSEQKEALEQRARELDMTSGQLARKLLALGTGSEGASEPAGRARKRRSPARTRERELAWLAQHRAHLSRYAGEWLIIEGDDLIAHGPDYLAVLKKARRRGVLVPFAYRVPEEDAGTAWMGL
jgi:hypothetical protein